ncbi:sigma-70 family RNA polymerase sigma factor [Micromonospora sp. NBC_01813]|uniref:sigma-70 family RNA polymerase sigma factor n=1 Tax=Micromonospora sp. NBC_01813 TaxID=2975988 RepID=UPI002DD8CB97|nr:sigma-70 family RNA polymerase sigma factor [Micromonospora sp. NBC_01813]WSA10432.1 sigma-70 family RNA polymerase sigma factor [Micromonospora sp. NBC_01813]
MSHAGPDDEQITSWAMAAGDGDRAAATAFIQATQRHVQRFLTHLVDAAEAEDLTQETYLRAMRSIRGFAGRSTARTWLLAIARRVAVDHIRALVVRPRVADLDDWQAVAESTSTGSRFEDALVLRQLLGGLDADRREAFVATQVLGLSYAEAAEVCDCPIGTIRSRVARARQDLVAAMTEQDQTPGQRLRAIS